MEEADNVDGGAYGVEDVVVGHGFARRRFHRQLGDAVVDAAGVVGVDGSQAAGMAGVQCRQVVPRFVAAQLGEQDAVGFEPHAGGDNLFGADVFFVEQVGMVGMIGGIEFVGVFDGDQPGLRINHVH